MSCKTILPTNLDEILEPIDLTGCNRIKDIKEHIERLQFFNNALKIDENFLNLLIDEYEANRFIDFEDKKRELVLYAQKNYPKLGTVSAVKKAIEAFGLSAELKEWWEFNGEPYTFNIEILLDREITVELINKLKRLIAFTKNVRSKINELICFYTNKIDLKIRAGCVSNIDGFSFANNKESALATSHLKVGCVANVSTMSNVSNKENVLTTLHFKTGCVAQCAYKIFGGNNV